MCQKLYKVYNVKNLEQGNVWNIELKFRTYLIALLQDRLHSCESINRELLFKNKIKSNCYIKLFHSKE